MPAETLGGMSVSMEKLYWRREALEIVTQAAPPTSVRQPSSVLCAYRNAVRTSDGSGRRSFGGRKENSSAADASCRSVCVTLPALSFRMLLVFQVRLVVTCSAQVIATESGYDRDSSTPRTSFVEPVAATVVASRSSSSGGCTVVACRTCTAADALTLESTSLSRPPTGDHVQRPVRSGHCVSSSRFSDWPSPRSYHPCCRPTE